MRKRPLGRTGLAVSEMGVGGIRFGSLSDGEVAGILSKAVQMGINLVDTARGYEGSEARIGRVLGANRDKVILSSKSTVRTGEGMRRDLEASLKALRTDYIDIYKAHNLRMAEDYDGAMAPGGRWKRLNGPARRASSAMWASVATAIARPSSAQSCPGALIL